MAELNFEFDNEDAFAPTSFQDKIEKLKLKDLTRNAGKRFALSSYLDFRLRLLQSRKARIQPGCDLAEWHLEL